MNLKVPLQHLVVFFYCVWPLIAMQSCMPFSHYRSAQYAPFSETVHYSNTSFTECNGFNSQPQAIPLKRKALREISGIAASLQYNGLLYVQEDSGHPNCLYLTNEKGEYLGRLDIRNSFNRDWEDIAVGPGPLPGHHYIYVADIGDNNAWHRKIHIYRFPEPELNLQAAPIRKTVKGVEAITLQYPDKPHNAEAILLDPLTRDLYIATKEDDSCRVYVARYPQSTHHKMVLEPVITLPFRLVTSGNIASNGLEILLRNEQVYWYWKRMPDETIAAALKKAPMQIVPTTNEPQGEAICFAADHNGYFTCSEIKKKQAPVIYRYERKLNTTASGF
ncbi:MAG TPA: hypothetical protein VIM79_26540 [Niastella sp.]